MKDGVLDLKECMYGNDQLTDISQLTDDISIPGPIHNGTSTALKLDFSSDNKPTTTWTERKCGSAVLKLRIDLELRSSDPNAVGTVVSKRIKYSEEAWSGAVLGFSHDFVPCMRG